MFARTWNGPNRAALVLKYAYFATALCLACSQSPAQDQAAKPPVVEEERPVSAMTNAFSINTPTQLADWQKRLTLGPGDILNISLYEQPDTARNGIAVGPDGRLSYLLARDVMAAGHTVDELRDILESTLQKLYLTPVRVVVVPQAYNSKKYYMLGNLVTKGVFTLDRPTTVLEAVARARGFVSTAQRRPNFMLADLSRSFLMRKEDREFRRVPVDFEALFLRADLSQNVALAPDDYLYFPPMDVQEAYVLGEVARPGPVFVTSDQSVVKSIFLRGGFTSRSYKARVLVVRGSLKAPQTVVVNSSDILSAKAADIRLQPRDIVYVSRKPWYRAEELVETAITAFLYSAIVTGTGQHVGPFITEPVFK